MKRVLVIGVLFSLLSLGTLQVSSSDRYFQMVRYLETFASLFKEVNEYYVDEISPSRLIKTGIDSMLHSLDPYTRYIPPDMVDDYRIMTTAQYGGIGAITRRIGSRTVIYMLFPGSPAEKSGLQIGDEVLQIDNRSIHDLTPEEAAQLMKGEIGKPVRLKVKRYGVNDPLTIQMKRERITVNNVPYYGMIDDHTGYIKLTEFTPNAGKNVRDAVIKLKEQQARAIILDLEDNPGGLLNEAVNICSIFLPRGRTVVHTRGKIREQNETYETMDEPVDLEIPVAVIINRGSASASEVVAGTLQDYDRAVIVGERSFGKGLVQLNRPLSYNAQVNITIAKYYTPSGRCVQAVDYSRRREDGSVFHVPDSLRKEFKTTNGRLVYDGGGIEPDVPVARPAPHALVNALLEQGLIFEYATHYANTHSRPDNARSFRIDENEYRDFLSWMSNRKYSYENELQKSLESLNRVSALERMDRELKDSFRRIDALLAEKRKDELRLYRDGIIREIEREVVAHHFLTAGTVELAFRYHPGILTANELLHDPVRYRKILRRQ